jgi:hypothetical protein
MAVRAPMAALAVQAGNKDTQMGFYKNDATAANNTSVNGIAIQGSSSPANIDNALRELAAQGKQFALDIAGATTVGGTADAITITANDSVADAYFDGMIIGFVAGSDNATTSPTANVNAIGAKAIKKALGSDGAELAVAAGDIQSGGLYLLRYRSAWASAAGAFQLIDLQHPAIDNPASNVIINGNFDIWQRGTSGTSGYVADRWINTLIGSTAAISRQSFTLGQTDVPNEPKYFHRVVVTSVAGSGNAAIFRQYIESVQTFAGQTVTLSFWAKADASKNIAIDLEQQFGTGGSPSTGVDAIGVTTCALTTSWQKFTVTANFPSISGKTLGTNNNDRINVNFWFDAGSAFNGRTNSLGQQSGTFDIAQVQLEAGDVATPFEVRTVEQELALCQRYFEKSYAQATAPATATTAGYITSSVNSTTTAGYLGFTHSYKVTKRASPTVVLYDTAGASGSTQRATPGVGSSNGQNGTVGSASNDAALVIFSVSGVSHSQLICHFTADAEL